MATRLPDESQQAAADAVVDLIDDGTSNSEGKLRLYSGTQPADADSSPNGDLLVEIDLADPAYGSADSSGTAELASTPRTGDGTAAAGSGTDAQSFRVVNKDEDTVFDGAVGASGSGAELELDNVSIAEDQTVSIESLDYTHPASDD